ncbi:MAG: hypothetical protein J6W60_01035, partial [Treponema sp.]|nr:hypothetical protein [Treponema sp.]
IYKGDIRMNLALELSEIEEQVSDLISENIEYKKQLTKATEIIKNIIRVTWGEGWNYSLDWKVKAEQFLKE